MELTKKTRRRGFVSDITFNSLTKGQAAELLRRFLSPAGLTIESGGIVLMIVTNVEGVKLGGPHQKRTKNHPRFLLKMVEEHDYSELHREYTVWATAKYNAIPDPAAAPLTGKVILSSTDNLSPEEVKDLQNA